MDACPLCTAAAGAVQGATPDGVQPALPAVLRLCRRGVVQVLPHGLAHLQLLLLMLRRADQALWQRSRVHTELPGAHEHRAAAPCSRWQSVIIRHHRTTPSCCAAAGPCTVRLSAPDARTPVNQPWGAGTYLPEALVRPIAGRQAASLLQPLPADALQALPCRHGPVAHDQHARSGAALRAHPVQVRLQHSGIGRA